MNKNDLIAKYEVKRDEAKLKSVELRRSYHKNKNINPREARWDELEREAYIRESYLTQKFIEDLRQMS